MLCCELGAMPCGISNYPLNISVAVELRNRGRTETQIAQTLFKPINTQ